MGAIQKQRYKNMKKALKKAFNKRARCLFVTIDVQKGFCDPHFNPERGTHKTDAIAKEISQFHQALSPLNLETAHVFTDLNEEGYRSAFGGFHHLTPHTNDTLAYKFSDAALPHPYEKCHALDAGNLYPHLKKNKKRNLFLAGFNLGACVEDTARAALALGYNVFILEDLCGNDAPNERHSSLATFKQEMISYASSLTRRKAKDAAPFPVGEIHFLRSEYALSRLRQVKHKQTLT